jgi:hypothetical protein
MSRQGRGLWERRAEHLIAVIFKDNAGGADGTRSIEQVQQLEDGDIIGDACRTNVGDAVALRIHTSLAWGVCEVCPEAVGRLETGPFSNKDERCLGLAEFADLVGQRDACLGSHNDGIQIPVDQTVSETQKKAKSMR